MSGAHPFRRAGLQSEVYSCLVALCNQVGWSGLLKARGNIFQANRPPSSRSSAHKGKGSASTLTTPVLTPTSSGRSSPYVIAALPSAAPSSGAGGAGAADGALIRKGGKVKAKQEIISVAGSKSSSSSSSRNRSGSSSSSSSRSGRGGSNGSDNGSEACADEKGGVCSGGSVGGESSTDDVGGSGGGAEANSSGSSGATPREAVDAAAAAVAPIPTPHAMHKRACARWLDYVLICLHKDLLKLAKYKELTSKKGFGVLTTESAVDAAIVALQLQQPTFARVCLAEVSGTEVYYGGMFFAKLLLAKHLMEGVGLAELKEGLKLVHGLGDIRRLNMAMSTTLNQKLKHLVMLAVCRFGAREVVAQSKVFGKASILDKQLRDIIAWKCQGHDR